MKPKRKVGLVLHISKSTGNLILKAETDVEIGESALDKSGKRVGVIYDFFGPVDTPYIAVKPRSLEESTKIIGEVLYLEEKQRKRKR
ncbi:H/ACA RNA-protein complex protein Gar1 [Candidatus Bathyarchaeota archaeon]|nr:H/ACA RNA-protein complex protein Gar1 [Candidatus Bathyarchaeota archaeon]